MKLSWTELVYPLYSLVIYELKKITFRPAAFNLGITKPLPSLQTPAEQQACVFLTRWLPPVFNRPGAWRVRAQPPPHPPTPCAPSQLRGCGWGGGVWGVGRAWCCRPPALLLPGLPSLLCVFLKTATFHLLLLTYNLFSVNSSFMVQLLSLFWAV